MDTPLHAILLISCPDTRGITATVTQFVFNNGGNIVHADQHIDEQADILLMRVEWSLAQFTLTCEQIKAAFTPIAQKFRMTWDLYFTNQRPSTAIFVSRPQHCLADLLYRHQSGQLPCNLAMIVSNHSEAKRLAESQGVPFYYFDVWPDNKAAQEKKQLELLQSRGVEVVILARYHQILSENFVGHFPNRIINIHHSFLPAFVGKDPYGQAYEKGVKIIGVTSHYVTAQLDDGPIIEQDTVRISHRDSVGDLKRKGEDLEKIALARAVRWHLERKILCYGTKTVIFD